MRRFFLFSFLALIAATTVHADWDPAEEARDRAAAQRARQAAAKAAQVRAAHKLEADKKTADVYRTQMKDAANGLNDQEVIAQYPKWNTARQNKMLADNQKTMSEIFARMSPEQRAMIEKQSGQSLDAMMKSMAPSATAKK
jgi:glutamine synthetase adenylyltransferase